MILSFRKSSYSGSDDNCVEVAPILDFRKSSYSGGTTANCVEIADITASFRKSSYSGAATANCVEVADHPTGAALRDSRHPELGHIPYPAAEWGAFLHQVKTERL